MFTQLDAGLLAQAFPSALKAEADAAASAVLKQLHRTQWTDRFSVRVEGEIILIPARLHFASPGRRRDVADIPSRMIRCLQTRSNDGFQRQGALGDLLTGIEPWSVPFVAALIGEYVIEILMDIDAAMSPELLGAMAGFMAANPEHWQLTRQRVASYWERLLSRHRRALRLCRLQAPGPHPGSPRPGPPAAKSSPGPGRFCTVTSPYLTRGSFRQ